MLILILILEMVTESGRGTWKDDDGCIAVREVTFLCKAALGCLLYNGHAAQNSSFCHIKQY